jgi:ATP phosphoribosyltransferase
MIATRQKYKIKIVLMLTIAISRGKAFEEELDLLKKSGYEINFRERELSISVDNLVLWFLKPKDVPVWVEGGVVDLGMVGLDILREKKYDILELLDLKIGKCRFSFARPKNKPVPTSKVVIATKFPNLSKKYAEKYFSEFEIVELHGSVEIAPKVGLSHIIADLVSTGRTLLENDLEEMVVLEEFSTYLISNRASFVMKYEEIEKLVLKLLQALGEKDNFLLRIMGTSID